MNPEVRFRFDNNLREVAEDPEEMKLAAERLRMEYIKTGDPECAGVAGSYFRIIGELLKAESLLAEAIEASRALGDGSSEVRNMIRLASVYQWQKRSDESLQMLQCTLEKIRADKLLEKYLHFAYQHIGKLMLDTGDPASALGYFESALELRIHKGDKNLIESSQMGIRKCRETVGGCTQENWEI